MDKRLQDLKKSESSYFLRIYIIMWTSAITYLFYRAEYLKIDSFAISLSFHSAEPPGNVAVTCLPKPIGVHYFGDFVSAACHAKLPSPYISEYATNYFPFSYIIMRPFAWLLNFGLGWSVSALFVFALLTIVVPVYFALQNHRTIDSVIFVILAVFLNQPFISMIDRGNIQILVTGFVVVGMYHLDSRKSWMSPVLIGFATAMKAYPVIYMAIYVRRREWKRLIISLITALFVSLCSLLMFTGGITENFRMMIRKILVFHDVTNTWLRYNSSLKALLLSVEEKNSGWAGEIAREFLSNYTVVILCLVLILSVVILTLNIDMFSFGILAATFCSLFLDLTATYVLTLFIVPLMYLSDSPTKPWTRFVSLTCLAILLVPKGISLTKTGGDHVASLASFLNPAMMILLIVLTLYEVSARGKIPKMVEQ
jgi:hypothetical protein